MKLGWKRYIATRQTFPHVDNPPWSVLDKDRMETVEGTEGMTEEQAKAFAAARNATPQSRGTN